MKKLLFILLATASFSAYADGDNTSMSSAILDSISKESSEILETIGADGSILDSINNLDKVEMQKYVHNKCVVELKGRTEWRVMSFAMGKDKQTVWENKICGCVSEDALKQLTTADMEQLSQDNSKRIQWATDVTLKAVTGCFNRLTQK